MSDKELLELLELAAKAAGIVSLSQPNCGVLIAFDEEGFFMVWNPLTDDGDALRLACDLGLRVFPIARTLSGAACSAVGSATSERLAEVADLSLDVRAATRRAIVLAAAEIGRGMSCPTNS
jgi:hypothetical protein